MDAGGGGAGASFADMAATLDPDVVLHQSPDLPWGGEFHGHAGYEDWARQMSRSFDRLAVEETRFFTDGDTVVITLPARDPRAPVGRDARPADDAARARARRPHRRVPAVLLERSRLPRNRKRRSHEPARIARRQSVLGRHPSAHGSARPFLDVRRARGARGQDLPARADVRGMGSARAGDTALLRSCWCMAADSRARNGSTRRTAARAGRSAWSRPAMPP